MVHKVHEMGMWDDVLFDEGGWDCGCVRSLKLSEITSFSFCYLQVFSIYNM